MLGRKVDAKWVALGAAVALSGCGGSASGDTDTDGDTDTESTTTGDSDTLPPSGSSASQGSMSDTTSSTGEPTSTTLDPATTEEPTTDEPTTMASQTDSESETGDGTGCCEAHSDPSCDEGDVAVCVCDELPECCVFGWDEACVERAMGTCEATCEGDETTGETEGEAESAGMECDETVQLEFDYEDAELSGSWQITTSQSGEGEIIFIPQPQSDGAVDFAVDVPCDDTWYFWVRGFDNGQGDSYLVTLDAEPDPAAVFELDCTPGGGGYLWQQLNWRDPENGGPCDYVEDPWTADWTAGTHGIQFSFRESRAISRVIVTNDEAFVP